LVKLTYWLSDVSKPGRDNLKVVQGSHLTNLIDGRPRCDIEWPDPAGAAGVIAEPGDAVYFDRRIWVPGHVTTQRTLHTYFLERLVPVCAQLLDAAVDAGDIKPGTQPYELMRGIGNLCIDETATRATTLGD
jgi:hypothetical protein